MNSLIFHRSSAFPKITSKQIIVCMLLNHWMQRRLLRKEVKCEKSIKNESSWEVISVTGGLRLLLDLFLNLNSDAFQLGGFLVKQDSYSEPSSTCSIWVSRPGWRTGGRPVVTSGPRGP